MLLEPQLVNLRQKSLVFRYIKRVWDTTITHRYFEYPIPAWYYGFLAGVEEIVTGRNTIIHELASRAVATNGIWLAHLKAEQAKSIESNYLEK